MTSYVLGFLFNEKLDEVVLIQKQRPAWQAGRWNAVGGHIESGETPLVAMVREFKEEAALTVQDWRLFAHLTLFNNDAEVFVFAACADLFGVHSVTDEHVGVFSADMVYSASALPTLGNVPWLMQMAIAVLNGRESAKAFQINEVA